MPGACWKGTLVSGQTPPGSYEDLVRKTFPPAKPPKTSEGDLDSLVTVVKKRQQEAKEASASASDRIDALRKLTLSELIPIFVELMEKYSAAGLSMEMDASNFLEGGREIRFEFGFGDYRSQLLGTVTTEAIAFHETRFAPDVRGELVSGPMLRLRNLTGKIFREFVCERLAVLLRTVVRHG